MSGLAIRVRGIVQGVGFRPNIWRLAKQHHITGKVWNDGEGVMIQAFGSDTDLQAFIRQIPLQLPPLARVDSLESQSLESETADEQFIIVASDNNSANTPITADAATCPDCLADIADSSNRRYGYAFTNCTHCGPRLSIVEKVPYDRCHTSMANFILCPECQQEYTDVSDRRFHAQATCCPVCGPQLWLTDQHGNITTNEVIKRSAELLQQGYIIAIKGLGGFHLACNANDSDAVNRLRSRKHRYVKPFALMAKDILSIERYADCSALEQHCLQDKAAPIVLLNAKANTLAAGIAPNDDKLGFMLPYTPLHTLLLQALAEPIVLTSGNISDEPQCIDNNNALEKLASIADYFLLHDRAIVNRLDDSVVRVMAGKARLLRRARGYSPEALRLPASFQQIKPILAMGAELKNSFCLIKNGQAIVSQHIGDLENAAVQHDYRHAIKLYQSLYDFKPECIAIDLHNGYLSSQYGEQLATEHQCQLIPIQHHHAHLAAGLAEYGFELDCPPVLAAIFDGLGMGENGELWGGEFLLGNYHSYRRLGRLQPIALLGGNQAMLEPWRNTYAQLKHYFDWDWLEQHYADLALFQLLQSKPLATLDTMLAKQLNSPLSSSCGRWFDAFAGALGLHSDRLSFEGQAAIALETVASPVFAEEQAYPQAYLIAPDSGLLVLSWRDLWLAVLADLKQGEDNSRIAARIIQTLATACCEVLMVLSADTGCDSIVLSGGVFQNRLLLEGVSERLSLAGKTVLSAQRYPMNDGGLALGQAVIAAAVAG